jgi:hypothetical protein
MHVKLCTFLATLCVLACGAWAMDLVTNKGKIYHDAEVKSVDRDGLRITYRDGVASIPFDDLTSEWQTRYGWTPEKSAALKAEKAAAAALVEQRRIAAAQVEQERQRVAAEDARVQAAQEVETAQREADRITAEKDALEDAKNAAETQRRNRRNEILAIIGIIYFLPGIIGFRKRNGFAILVFNLFLGWTLIGWVMALVWACLRDGENVIQHNVSTTHHYTFAERERQAEDAEYTEAPIKRVRGRVLPARDGGEALPPTDDRRLPPRR